MRTEKNTKTKQTKGIEKQRIEKRKKKGIASVVLFGISLCALLLARYRTGFADWYVTHIYQVVVGKISRAVGVLPFSLSEVLLYGALVLLAVSLLRMFVKTVAKMYKKEDFLAFVIQAAFAAGMLFTIYTFQCGINYHRSSFEEISGIHTRNYTVDELETVCKILGKEVMDTAKDVPRDQRGIMQVRDSKGKSLEQKVTHAMEQLGDEYPDLAGSYPDPKGLLVSEFLSYQGLTGIYSPFTVEANYNQDMTPYNIPFTMCHELSHLRGFMEEDEANFIAWLACRQSQEVELRYSAALSGWLYASNLLWDNDKKAYEEAARQIPEEAWIDLHANNEFWEEYEGSISEAANQVNDIYLKSNGQKNGVESYDKMTDLMVAYLLDERYNKKM